MPGRTVTTILALAVFPFLLFADYPSEKKSDSPEIHFGAEISTSMKVENSGEVHNLFDELGFHALVEFSEFSRFYAYLEIGELMGYNAGWTSGPAAAIFPEDGFDKTEVYIESDVLAEGGLETPFSLNLRLGYGNHQEVLVAEFTGYRYERASTSGIDGFDFSTGVGFNDRFFLSGAFNPASFNNADKDGGSGPSYPDIFGAFFMDNDHTGSSWGPLIHFTSSSMQLFYDSSANLENNPLYDDISPGEAMTLGIGGDLAMNFAGMEIYGFGMTEYFLMYNRNDHDILQAQWAAGFGIPVLSGLNVNLSGNNAVVFGGGDGSYMNFGLDARLMVNSIFGVFGAVAAIGILDDAGVSAEGGVCLEFKYFQIYSGYSDHAMGTDPKYAKGAFDKVEVKNGSAPGGGFFLTLKASF